MTTRSLIDRVVQHEDLNFLLTNRIPRRWLTLFVGWLSRIEHPWVSCACIAIWRLFSDLDLSDAKKSRFDSLRDCFTRELKDGARPIDMNRSVLVSPCDALVGACGLDWVSIWMVLKRSLKLTTDPLAVRDQPSGTWTA